jgi:hypothetical protein
MYKIKVSHLLIKPNFENQISGKDWQLFIEKQNKSIDYFSKTSKYFYKYTQIFNERSNFAPFETCNLPECYVSSPELAPESGAWLSIGHYGAFQAHRNAILTEFTDDIDALLIIEGDVVSDLDPKEFSESVNDALEFGNKNSASFITLSNAIFGEGSDAPYNIIEMGKYDKIKHFLCCNCYLIFKSEKENIQNKLKDTKWMAFDIWLYWNYDGRVPIFKIHDPIAYENSGFSLIDFKLKDSNK